MSSLILSQFGLNMLGSNQKISNNAIKPCFAVSYQWDISGAGKGVNAVLEHKLTPQARFPGGCCFSPRRGCSPSPQHFPCKRLRAPLLEGPQNTANSQPAVSARETPALLEATPGDGDQFAIWLSMPIVLRI